MVGRKGDRRGECGEDTGGKDVDNYPEDSGRPTGLEKVKGRGLFRL